jgi:hypothetical protein
MRKTLKRTLKPGFDPSTFHVGFKMDGFSLGQASDRVVRSPLTVTFHQCSVVFIRDRRCVCLIMTGSDTKKERSTHVCVCVCVYVCISLPHEIIAKRLHTCRWCDVAQLSDTRGTFDSFCHCYSFVPEWNLEFIRRFRRIAKSDCPSVRPHGTT